MQIDEAFYRGIRHYGTHASYERLIRGKVDLIYECRLPSADERELMKQEGVELDFTPIALDAFVFLRHRDNPVTNLSAEQVRDIYTRGFLNRAKTRNWKDVGGPDHKINAYVRNRNSGSQETMKNLVMQKREMVSGRSMTGVSMMGPYNLLKDDEYGVGFTFYYYQRYMAPWGRPVTVEKPEKQSAKKIADAPVQMLAIDGVHPTRRTIAEDTYPWVTRVYVVTRMDLDGKDPAARLRDWLVSSEGQMVVGETGYVPIEPTRN